MRRMDRGGFTLVEVLVAASLLALVPVPVLSLATTNSRRVAVSHHHLRAQLCARQAVAALACRPYGGLVRLAGSPETSGLDVPEGFPGQLRLTIKDPGAGSIPQSTTHRMLVVAVTVSWSPYGKQSSRGSASVTLSRLRAPVMLRAT